MFKTTTKRLLLALMLGTAGGLHAAAPAEAALGIVSGDGIAVRETSIIATPEIRIGDLFANIGEAAAIVVAPAPAPGERLVVQANELAAVAAKFELQWEPRNWRERVVIERAADQVPLSRLKTALEAALMAGPVDDDIEIDLANNRLRLLVAKGADDRIAVRDLRYDRRTQRFAAVVTAGDNPTLIEVSGEVHPIVEVPVPTRHILPGEIISSQDIVWERVRANRATYNTATSLDALVDHQARRPLSAGRMIRRSDVKPLELVTKGELATVIFKTPYMTLTTRAKALQAGANGQTIRLRNAQSEKIILATVIAPRVVTVEAQSLATMN